MTREEQRLVESREGINWKQWGPYLSERQWATVREDYSEHGNAWEGLIHDHARSKSYRWGEDGIGGFCNEDQRICFAWAFWNGKDSIIKERLFGLSGNEGNHGEDVKELYYYLDSTPTHSYMRMLYKYPQNRFPYKDLIEVTRTLTKKDPEYEIIDTGIFDNNEYFDVFMDYAKRSPDDLLFKAEIWNRGPNQAELTVLPTFWFRNTWSSGRDNNKPKITQVDENKFLIKHHSLGNYHVYLDGSQQEQLYCENATNRKRLYNTDTKEKYFKDGINDYIVEGKPTVNPQKKGTKVSAHYKLTIPSGEKVIIKLRMSKDNIEQPFESFDSIFGERLKEADEFYAKKQSKVPTDELKKIQRQAFAGLMWSKQFYYYNVNNWIHGDPGRHKPSEERKHGRNSDWKHMFNYDILSMPDKWEYPWFAAWDLAFHCIPLARVDPDFAKDQLLILLKERYIHPNGQIPAYEWNFSDVNPPVHAWAVLRVFKIDRKMNAGKGDFDFLQKAFHKLLVNFTWWINRKDKDGSNIFEGGFLGLDNIGVFDRNHPIVENARLEQADSTSWMAMFSLNMLRIALDLSSEFPIYQDMAIKFFEHFLYISGAMNGVEENKVDLWDDEDNFYYDVMHIPGKEVKQMRVRSMVGLIPLFAVEILNSDVYNKLPEFREKLEFFLKEKPKLASLVSRWGEPGKGERRLLSILRGFRMKKILERMLDPEEFLSPYGIRALSKYHEKNPYQLKINGDEFKVKYLPGESDSSFFGGNSNWRGPVWFPVNYLILESMLKFYFYYGDDYKIEFPVGSGNMVTLLEAVRKLTESMMNLFLPDDKGNRPIYGNQKKFQEDPHFRDYILFYEYFNGDTGLGLGANHQTGWTGLIAEMIHRYYNTETVIKVR